MILVDSSVWIDYFKGTITAQTERLDGLLGYEPLAIGDLILAEVLQGFHSERDFNEARKMLTALTRLSHLKGIGAAKRNGMSKGYAKVFTTKTRLN